MFLESIQLESNIFASQIFLTSILKNSYEKKINFRFAFGKHIVHWLCPNLLHGQICFDQATV